MRCGSNALAQRREITRFTGPRWSVNNVILSTVCGWDRVFYPFDVKSAASIARRCDPDRTPAVATGAALLLRPPDHRGSDQS